MLIEHPSPAPHPVSLIICWACVKFSAAKSARVMKCLAEIQQDVRSKLIIRHMVHLKRLQLNWFSNIWCVYFTFTVLASFWKIITSIM